MAVFAAFRAGKMGFKMLKYLYRGAKGGVAGSARTPAGKLIQGSGKKVPGLRQWFTRKGDKLGKNVKLSHTPKVIKGKYGSTIESRTIKGGFRNKARAYGSQAMYGIGDKGGKALRHVRKHHKGYTTAAAGAAIWDVLDDD